MKYALKLRCSPLPRAPGTTLAISSSRKQKPRGKARQKLHSMVCLVKREEIWSSYSLLSLNLQQQVFECPYAQPLSLEGDTHSAHFPSTKITEHLMVTIWANHFMGLYLQLFRGIFLVRKYGCWLGTFCPVLSKSCVGWRLSSSHGVDQRGGKVSFPFWWAGLHLLINSHKRLLIHPPILTLNYWHLNVRNLWR